jgi:hypothetical protein
MTPDSRRAMMRRGMAAAVPLRVWAKSGVGSNLVMGVVVVVVGGEEEEEGSEGGDRGDGEEGGEGR